MRCARSQPIGNEGWIPVQCYSIRRFIKQTEIVASTDYRTCQSTLLTPTTLLTRSSIRCTASFNSIVPQPYSCTSIVIPPTCLAILRIWTRLNDSAIDCASDFFLSHNSLLFSVKLAYCVRSAQYASSSISSLARCSLSRS